MIISYERLEMLPSSGIVSLQESILSKGRDRAEPSSPPDKSQRVVHTVPEAFACGLWWAGKRP